MTPKTGQEEDGMLRAGEMGKKIAMAEVVATLNVL
jgi:hypothetical protein